MIQLPQLNSSSTHATLGERQRAKATRLLGIAWQGGVNQSSRTKEVRWDS
uniref:Uncharacterized protein n=1 Tax=Gopherus agassizii TaxID=38772 RepID=A0A452IKM4_9SAUR